MKSFNQYLQDASSKLNSQQSELEKIVSSHDRKTIFAALKEMELKSNVKVFQ